MAHKLAEPTAPPRSIHHWIASPWVHLLFSILVGVVLAQAVTGQLEPRWVKALVGVIFLFALLRLPLFAVISLFLVAFPFPTVIFIGNTNVIFVLFMLCVWGVKVRLGLEPAPPKTYLDYACWCYIGIHCLSLVNVETSEDFNKGLAQIGFYSAAVGLYFLISKVLRSERHLRTALYALTVTSLLVSITGVMEYFVPTLRLIPDWFIAAGPSGRRFSEGGRLGGVFGAHNLLADFSAMMFFLTLFLAIRTRRLFARTYLILLMAADIFLIFVTYNRGGFIILVIGLLYLLWLGGGGITLRRFVVALPIVALVGLAIAVLSQQLTKHFVLWMRLMETQFEGGAPDDRVEVWQAVLREIPNHLWLGHGPYYNLLGGVKQMGRAWPHSAYLMYLWSTGVVGLAIFLWILIKVIVRSYPGRKLRLRTIPFAHGSLVVLHIQIVQFALAQIRDEHQRGNVYVYIMWMLFGLSVAAKRLCGVGEPRPQDLPPGD